MKQTIIDRFIKYVKVNTRSDETSTTIPSTESQVIFAHDLVEELVHIGMSNVHYKEENGYVVATLPSNTEKKVPAIGFIAHMDTADFNAENIQPKLVENYDGQSIISLDKAGKYQLNPSEFPNLKNYVGETLITTNGETLLGADDKAGITEIITAMEYLLTHPEIKHGDISVAFGPDEEIGTGANHFDVKDFPVAFAYTMDGGPVGELEYETFNAAGAEVTFHGKNVHPGTAKNTMINALQLAIEFHQQLPQDEVPEKTEGTEGFFHLYSLTGEPEIAKSGYIIRDHDKYKFEQRKQLLKTIQEKMNQKLKAERVVLTMEDQYYNMGEIIQDHMEIIELAKSAMINLNIQPDVKPVRGGTDGSKISFMGIPTPNIFAGGENMHGRFEFVSVESMEKATNLIIEIVRLNAE